jgi:hypothetical protein
MWGDAHARGTLAVHDGALVRARRLHGAGVDDAQEQDCQVQGTQDVADVLPIVPVARAGGLSIACYKSPRDTCFAVHRSVVRVPCKGPEYSSNIQRQHRAEGLIL